MNKIVALFIFWIFICSSTAYCCVGARPLAMGGAFVAVADDINAVYWNPAGLSKLSGKVVSLSLEPDKFADGSFKSAYPYFFAAGAQIGKAGVALSYVQVSDWCQDEGRGKAWLYAAMGTKVNPKLSIGVKAGYREVNNPSFEFFRSLNPDSFSQLPLIFDMGLLYECQDNVRLGLLIQGVTNFRPGVSFMPSENLLVSYELYDALNLSSSYYRSRFGLEYQIQPNFFLRLGMNESLTLGCGYKSKDFIFDCFMQTYNSFLQYYSSGISITFLF